MAKKKKAKINFTDFRSRILFALLILFFALLCYKLVKVAFFSEIDYNKKVLNQRVNEMNKSSGDLEPKRGSISDVNGVPLAESLDVYSIIYDPKLLLDLKDGQKDGEDVVKEINTFLYEHLELETGSLERLLEERDFSHYEKIAIDLDYKDAEDVILAIEKAELKGVSYEKNFMRKYPHKDLASDVIGFVSRDGSGLLGIEGVYDEYLRGKSGREFGSASSAGDFEMIKEKEEAGADVITNIDLTVQGFAMEAMQAYVEKNNPLGMEVILMDPRDGRILGMASYPSYDLNSPYDLDKFFTKEEQDAMSDEEISRFRNELWRNGAISNTYEPGSTFKPFTLAMGLEEHRVDAGSNYNCKGFKIPFKDEQPIHCHKLSGHGNQDYVKALGNSCNVAFMDMGVAIGKELFAKYIRAFGFGSITGVDLNGESSARSLLYKEEQLNPVELQTSSFGQGFNVTPIQLITGFSSLINGGFLYEPHIVNRVVDTNGTVLLRNEKSLQRVVISKGTASRVSKALAAVVDDGSGRRAKIEGYSIGGKTGQAEKGDRDTKDYIISFIGYSPIESPEIIALVVIDDPDKDDVSSLDAVIVFREIMEKVLPYMRVSKDYSTLE